MQRYTKLSNRDRLNFVFVAESADQPGSDQFRFRYLRFCIFSFSVQIRFRFISIFGTIRNCKKSLSPANRLESFVCNR